MIVIVDYGMGNLRSVYNKFRKLGISAEVSSDHKIIARADKIVLPGVGHFKSGMQKMREYGLIDVLNDKILKEKSPVLGICLGIQLFTKKSEEGNAEGFGWIDAQTVRFRIPDDKRIKFKIPHVGWNTLEHQKRSVLLNNIDPESLFYFVHSYHLKTEDPSIVSASSQYCYEFVSAIEKDNIYGLQFHPEKSQEAGLQIFKNFSAI